MFLQLLYWTKRVRLISFEVNALFQSKILYLVTAVSGCCYNWWSTFDKALSISYYFKSLCVENLKISHHHCRMNCDWPTFFIFFTKTKGINVNKGCFAIIIGVWMVIKYNKRQNFEIQVISIVGVGSFRLI